MIVSEFVRLYCIQFLALVQHIILREDLIYETSPLEDHPIGIALPNHLMGNHFIRSVSSPLQGKADLKDFGISDEICELKGISNLRFKKLV